MSNKKRIVSLTSRSGKPLHISAIGNGILSNINVNASAEKQPAMRPDVLDGANGGDMPNRPNKANMPDASDGPNRADGANMPDAPDGANKANMLDAPDGADKANMPDASDGPNKADGANMPDVPVWMQSDGRPVRMRADGLMSDEQVSRLAEAISEAPMPEPAPKGNRGRDGGYRDGREGGYRDGREGGYRDGRDGGYRDGRDGGYRDGRDGGYRDGREGGYRDRDGRGREGVRKRAVITRMCSGADWAKQASLTIHQKQLCGPLWYEGEICILFADTNVGKSILAVQLADMIARGAFQPTTLPELAPQTFAQPVLYADFELSMAQFARRYSCDDPDPLLDRIYYDFSPSFHRVELYYDLSGEGDAEEYATKEFADLIIADLEQRIKETESRVLIIDNITFMATGTETAADAMPLMKKLVALKKRHDLSILLLAHTPKRALSNPLTRNDLQGSKMLINFADSAFALGESTQGKNIRYIKQIKQRNCEQVYDGSNVLVCTLGQVFENFVGFSSIGVTSEDSHLADRPSKMSDERVRQVKERVRELKAEGKSMAEISASVGMSRSAIYRAISN